MAFKPIGKFIVSQLIDEEVETASGLVLSGDDVDKLRYRKATIVKVGTDVNITDGSVIYFDKAQSFTMVIDGNQYTILREIDVVLVLSEGSPV
jgi:co-chaperonin GroES (HSP10)